MLRPRQNNEEEFSYTQYFNSAYGRYNFRLLDTSGWNFRHAHYHEEGRRTLYKAYGIKFVIIVQVLQLRV